MALFEIKYEMRQHVRKWSYIWYRTHDGAAREALNAVNSDVRNALLAMHNSNTVVFRKSARQVPVGAEITVPRNTYITTELADHGTYPPGTDNRPDLVTTAAILELRGSAGARRTMAIRGLSDDAVARFVSSGRSDPSNALLTRMNTFIGAMATNQNQIRVKKGPDENDAPWRDVRTIAPEAASEGTNILVTTRNDHGLQAGMTITFSVPTGSNVGVNVLRGDFRVLAPVTLTSFVVGAPYQFQTESFAPVGLRVRRVVWDVENISANDSRFLRFSGRDTGGLGFSGAGQQKRNR